MAKRILVVEDDVGCAESLQDMLCEFGFDTAVACDGVMALEVLGAANPLPDIILLDLHMPNMDGWQLKEKLKKDERYSHIPIIIMSADTACTSVEAEAHLVKPFELNTVMELLDPSRNKN